MPLDLNARLSAQQHAAVEHGMGGLRPSNVNSLTGRGTIRL